jgi:hypothetical protein
MLPAQLYITRMNLEAPQTTSLTAALAIIIASQEVQLHTGLPSLPPEIFLEIARHLSHIDLLTLAEVCKGLHHVALRYYLQLHGVQDLRSDLKIAFLYRHPRLTTLMVGS